MPKNLASPAMQQTICFDRFRLGSADALLFCENKLVPLEPRASRVLLYLVNNRERLVSKEELLEQVWSDVFTTDDVLKKAVSQIRRALADDRENPRFVQTLHRRGYRFIAEVAENPENGGERINGFKAANPPEPAKLGESSAAELNADPDFDQLVGRAVEMEILQAEYRRTLRGQGQPVLVTGEPGVGKTQLAAKFERWASSGGEQSQNAVCVRARFFDYEAARVSSYNLFLDLIGEVIAKLSPPDAAAIGNLRSAIKTQTDLVLPDDFFVANSTAERSQAQSDAFHLIAPLSECFVRLSEKRPLILVLDDLQWANDASLKIIGYLMRTAANAPLMIIGLIRKADIEAPEQRLAQWLQAQAVYRSYTNLNLTPLTQTEYRFLVSEIFRHRLDESEMTAEDLRTLYRTTGGNPYFLVETIRMLIAEGAIEKIAPGNPDSPFVWRWRGLRNVPLPETVRMAAHAKLARLTAPTRDYVERAAVLGDAFHLETLERMYDGDETSAAELETYLDEAISAQVLTEQGVSGSDDCQFYHTTLRRAVYSDLSPRRRKRLHARAGSAIETIYAKDIERVAAALGAHYEAAGNARLSFEHNLRAGELASLRFDWTEAAECAERARRAAELLDADPATRLSDVNRLSLLLIYGEALMSIGRRIEAETVFSRAVALAETTDDKSALAAALGLKAHTEVLLGHYRESLTASREALKLSREADDSQSAAHALLQIASAQYALCEYEESCQALQTVIDEFGGTSGYYAAVALGKLGWVRALQSRYQEAKDLLARALAFHQETGDVRQRVVLALCLDWAEHGAGNYEQAIGFATEARDLAHNTGEPYSEAVAIMRIGKSRLAQGLWEESENIFQTVLAKLRGKNAVHCEAETLWLLGRAKILQGDETQATRLLAQALSMIREIGDREDEFRILIDVAALATGTGDATRGLATAQNAAQIAEEIKIFDGVGAALVEQANALLALNRSGEAYGAVTRAVHLLETAQSGVRWRAYHTLGSALSAVPSGLIDENIKFKTPENAWRRALELLEQIREQLAALDSARRAQFTRAHQAPARSLCQFLFDANRTPEAAEIARAWQLDLN